MTYKRRRAALVVLVTQVWSAHAFYDQPTLNPPAPVEGQEISIDIRAGECHQFIGDPRDGVVTQNGNQIKIVVPALFNGFCTFPTRTRPYVVGALPPGEYTLEVWYQLAPVSGGGPPWFMGRLSFDVAPQGVVIETPIPTLSSFFKLLLILASVASAGIYQKKFPRNCIK
jgi:hypothetical protein